MGDYLDEINTALAINGKQYRYDSLEDVEKALEDKAEKYDDKFHKWGINAPVVFGSVVIGGLYTEEVLPGADFPSEVWTILGYSTFLGGSLAATGIGLRANKFRKKRDNVYQLKEDVSQTRKNSTEEPDPYDVIRYL